MKQLETVWQRHVHQQVNVWTALGPELVLVPERLNRLVRLEPTNGSLLWEARVENTWGWLAVNANSCLWLNQHSLLQCFDLASGEPRWHQELRGGIYGHLVPVGDLVLVGGWRGYTDMLAVDASSGEVAWTLPARGSGIRRPLVTPWGIATSAAGSSRMEFRRPHDGALLFEIEAPGELSTADAAGSFTVTTTGVFAFSDRTTLFALPFEQQPVWRRVLRHSRDVQTTRPAIVDDRIIFVDCNEFLCVYDLNGRFLWSVPWPHNRTDLLPITASSDGFLFVGSSFGRVAVFNPLGDLVARATPGKRITAQVSLAGSLLLCGTSGAVQALRWTPAPT